MGGIKFKSAVKAAFVAAAMLAAPAAVAFASAPSADAATGTSAPVAIPVPSHSGRTGALSFKGGETGTKTITIPVSQSQCRALLASKNMHGDDTACIETMTAGSTRASPPRSGAASSSSGWHYAYHYTETCWTYPGFPQCYFLALKDEATFQYNYSTVWVEAGTGVTCSRPQQVFPDSASIWWCGGWNNGGAPVHDNGYQHWMNVGDNATVCIGVGPQACKDHWQRLKIDIWGNIWFSGGWF
jgi:hypothetical protein